MPCKQWTKTASISIMKTISSDNTDQKNMPGFMKNITDENTEPLDVRPILASGTDPLNVILEKIRQLPEGKVLKLINTFEPTPLIMLLGKKGFESHVEVIDENLVHTYFYKGTKTEAQPVKPSQEKGGWEEVLQRYKDNLITIDVRELEMPRPMMAILETLDTLPAGKALFVYHKRLPVFLLPELSDRQLEYRIREISDTEVHLLIFKA